MIVNIKENKKTIIILILNIIFYATLDVRFLSLLLSEIIITYFIYLKIAANTKSRKIWLIIGIILEITVLAYFKYADFWVADKDASFKILMPIGISYYTFKILSFLFESYKNEKNNHIELLPYAAYVSFFPQIICGPIARADEIIPQFKCKSRLTETELIEGFGMILSGLFKKIVIADRLSVYTDAIFDNPSHYPALAGWIAAFLFSIQIYCDFAGYSEISIGICRLMKIRCSENFNKPYFSANIKEFWNRWHISLSTWLRDYIYIPLGGNKHGRMRKHINVMLTFLISGIWHGNGLNFIYWGILHGILNILSVERAKSKVVACIQVAATFVSVTFGWILFRAESFGDSIQYIKNMFVGFSINYSVIVDSIIPFTGDYSCAAYFMAVMTFILVLFILELCEYIGIVKSYERVQCIKSSFYLLAVLLFGVAGQNSFLYANF